MDTYRILQEVKFYVDKKLAYFGGDVHFKDGTNYVFGRITNAEIIPEDPFYPNRPKNLIALSIAYDYRDPSYWFNEERPAVRTTYHPQRILQSVFIKTKERMPTFKRIHTLLNEDKDKRKMVNSLMEGEQL